MPRPVTTRRSHSWKWFNVSSGVNGNNTQGEFIVKAPISGFIVQKAVTDAQAIRTDNGNPMFTISDLKECVGVGKRIRIQHRQGSPRRSRRRHHPVLPWPGNSPEVVDKIMHVLGSLISRVTKIRVVIDNPGYALRPLMFASVEVSNTLHQQALYVPKTALIFDNSRYYVLVYHGAGKADITPDRSVE